VLRLYQFGNVVWQQGYVISLPYFAERVSRDYTRKRVFFKGSNQLSSPYRRRCTEDSFTVNFQSQTPFAGGEFPTLNNSF
jgi:hypothetical protein